MRKQSSGLVDRETCRSETERFDRFKSSSAESPLTCNICIGYQKKKEQKTKCNVIIKIYKQRIFPVESTALMA